MNRRKIYYLRIKMNKQNNYILVKINEDIYCHHIIIITCVFSA